MTHPGRNDPCPCRSGKKYKQCCALREAAQATRVAAADRMLQSALQQHQTGQLAAAAALYRQVLASVPGHADALHFLGVIAHQTGDQVRAVDLIGQAIQTQPCAPMFCNLGLALQAQGKLDAALVQFRQALALQPQHAQAHNNLGLALQELGQLDTAVTHFRQALAARPDYAEAHTNLGLALQMQGHIETAIAQHQRALALQPQMAAAHCNLGSALQAHDQLESAAQSYRTALAIDPDFVKAHNNLGSLLHLQGAFDAALACYRQALARDPNFTKALRNLADTLRAQGDLEAAIAHYRQALTHTPDDAGVHNDLGLALQMQGQAEASAHSYRQALALAPNFARAHNNLGNALKDQGLPDQAIDCYQRALAIDPDYVNAHNNLGMARLELGQLDQALAAFDQALARAPGNTEVLSNRLFALGFDANGTPDRYLTQARAYGALVASQATPYPHSPHSPHHSHAAPPRPHKTRLKVGLVSGDFRFHPVGFFLEQVLAQIDPARVELVAYSTVAMEDALTARIKPHCAAWHRLQGLDDATAARKIHADEIDILFDLSGHTAHNRLPLFAWKPAPVQVSWLGYGASTGVPGIDYLLADAVSVLPQQHAHFSETICTLPATRLCFSVPDGAPAPAPLPALRNGYVTLGSFQHLSKLNPAVLAVWSKILRAVPGARLRLQNRQLASPALRQSQLQTLAQAGIAPERVLLAAPQARPDYLAAHAEVDMILDPFPYPGGTTTCEALWMGVPTLTLAGSTLLARQGASLLTCAGLPQWIAQDSADYVTRAITHASDLPALAHLRTGLRQQVQNTPLFDATRFARAWENALWEMWSGD